VEQKPAKENGELIHWLKKNEKLNKSFASNKEGNGALRSELSYAMLASGDKYHLLEVKPKTGRHHQIRVQLSGMGCIIKGDLKYGAKRSNEDASISLHAREVEFIHPIKKENIIITAPVPKDKLWQFFEEQLGGGK
jgi:23S rRNA pseudouridine1911/1915/1917 synthase